MSAAARTATSSARYVGDPGVYRDCSDEGGASSGSWGSRTLAGTALSTASCWRSTSRCCCGTPGRTTPMVKFPRSPTDWSRTRAHPLDLRAHRVQWHWRVLHGPTARPRPSKYIDGWSTPRSGGSRTHRGTCTWADVALIGTDVDRPRRLRKRLCELTTRLRTEWGSYCHLEHDNSNEFQPAALTVARGPIVTWVNTGVTTG